MLGLVEELRVAYAREGMLFELHCDLLYQCDLDCEHCYLDDKATRNLPTSFWKDLLDQAAEMQVLYVTLSGGELFLRPDAFEIIAHARRRGLVVHCKTHGGRLDADDVRRLEELRVASVQVSYYSHRPEVHDAVTRRPGSHAKTLAAMSSLREAGVPVLAAMSVMKRNKDDVPAVLEQCRELGVIPRVDGTIRAAKSGDTFPQDTALSREDRISLERLRGAGSDGCGVGAPDERWAERKSCSAGHLILYVDPEGRVTPCGAWPMPVGDLGAGERLADIWERSSSLRRVRDMRRGDRSVCAGCHLRGECDFCPGQAWLEHRDAEKPPRAVCEATWAKATAAAREAGEDDPAPPPPLAEDRRRPRFRILTSVEARAAGR
ncbi:MAG: radical SAM/SPASM domain-containing protein [Myxococcota bacterium]